MRTLIYLSDPSLHLCLMLILIFYFYTFKLKKLQLYTLLFSIFYSSLVFLSPIPYYLMAHLENQADLLKKSTHEVLPTVYLGGGCLIEHRALSQIFTQPCTSRALNALLFAKKNKSPFFILSGYSAAITNKVFHPEMNSIKKIGQEFQIDTKWIIENKSRNTYENALFTKKILENHSIKKFYLVSSATHLPRAYKIFKDLGMTPILVPVDYRVLHRASRWTSYIGWQNHQLWLSWLYELGAGLWYKFAYP